MIDCAVAALERFDWVKDRLTPTQLRLIVSGPDGSIHVAYVDAADSRVQATAYPRLGESDSPSFPEPHVRAVAEMLNRIASAGVPVIFGLDLDHRVVRVSNYVYITENANIDPEPILYDLTASVVGLSVVYHSALRQVAFGEATPDTALREIERRIARGVAEWAREISAE